MSSPNEDLEQLVDAVRNSAKYHAVCVEFIRRIGAVELTRRPRLKEAVKATKNKLHQTAGAYLDSPPPYDRWLTRLREAAQTPQPDKLRSVCQDMMAHHASTRERLPILDTFFHTTLSELGPIRSILDVACGLNPLAIPWMPMAADATYYAYDIYEDMSVFLNQYWGLVGVQGRAWARDIGVYIPPEQIDVALVLKTLPCLEQVDKHAGVRLLAGLNARHVLVSFPVRSLGGYDKGMADTYTDHLARVITDHAWLVRRFEFDTELAFLIHKE